MSPQMYGSWAAREIAGTWVRGVIHDCTYDRGQGDFALLVEISGTQEPNAYRLKAGDLTVWWATSCRIS